MASTEKFCLRWNDFESNISIAFRELREEKDFFDVTLACDDNQIQAHKVILSACSPFFRNVLRRNPHQHPLLYLKGVKYSELMSVLNFMYMGEVNVAQEELNSFLAVAEDLRVKGLTQTNSETSSKSIPSKLVETPKQLSYRRDVSDRDSAVIPPPKRPRPVNLPSEGTNNASIKRTSYQTQVDDDIQEVVPVKTEPREPPPMTQQVGHHNNQVIYSDQGMGEDHTQQGTVALDESYADESYEYEQYTDSYVDGAGMLDQNSTTDIGTDGNKALQAVVASKMYETVDNEGRRLWQCGECEYARNKKDHVTKHVEQKHSGLQFQCDYCQAIFHRRDTYKDHVKKKHFLAL